MSKTIKKIIISLLLALATCCMMLLIGINFNGVKVGATVIGLPNSATLRKISATSGVSTGGVEYVEFDGYDSDTYFLVEFTGKNVPNFAVNANRAYSTWNGEGSAVCGLLLTTTSELGQTKLSISPSLNTKGTHNSNSRSFPVINGYSPGLASFLDNERYLMIVGYDKTGVTAQNFSVYIFVISDNGTIYNVYDRLETINALKPSGNKAIIYANVNYGPERITFNYQNPASTLDGLIENLSDNCSYKKQLESYFKGTQGLTNYTKLNKATATSGIASNVDYISFDGMGGDTFFMVEFVGKNAPNFAIRAKTAYSEWNAEPISSAGILLSQSYEDVAGNGVGNALRVSNGLNTMQTHATIVENSGNVGPGLDCYDDNTEYLMIVGAEYDSKLNSTASYIKIHYYLYTVVNNGLTQVGKYVAVHGVLNPDSSADVAVIYPNINYGGEFVVFNYVKPQPSLHDLISSLPETCAYKTQLKTSLSSSEPIGKTVQLNRVNSSNGIATGVEYLKFSGFNGGDTFFMVEFTGKNVPNFTVCANEAYSEWNAQTYEEAGYSLWLSSTHGANRAYVSSGVSTGLYNYPSDEAWLNSGLDNFSSNDRYLMIVGYDRIDGQADVFSIDVYSISDNGLLTEFYSQSESINVNVLSGDNAIIYPNVNNGPDSVCFSYVTPSTSLAGVVGNLPDDCPYKIQLINKYSLNVLTVNVLDEDGKIVSKVGSEKDKPLILPENTFGFENFVGWLVDGKIYREGDNIVQKDISEIKAVCLDYEMLDGASVRLDDNSNGYGGLRFTLKVKTVQIESLGCALKVYGTVIPTDKIEGNFVFEQNSFKELTKSIKKSDGYTYYHITLTNVLLSNYNREFSAKANLRITYNDGTNKDFITPYDVDKNSRSVYNVAKEYYNHISQNGGNISNEELLLLKSYIDNTLNLNFSINNGNLKFSEKGVADGLDNDYNRAYSVISSRVTNHVSGANLVSIEINIDVPEKLIDADGTPHLSLTLWAGGDNFKRVNAYVSSYDKVNHVATVQTLIYCEPEFYYSDSKSVFELFGYSGVYDDWFTRDGVTTLLPKSLATDENIKLYKDSGLNVLNIGNAYNFDGIKESFDSSKLKAVMDIAYENGLKCIVFEKNLHSLTQQTTSLINGSANSKFASQNELVEYVKNCLKEVSKHPAFYGVSLDDEPSYTQFDAMGEVYRAIQEVVPGVYVNMNLWAYAESWAFKTDNIYCSNYNDFDNPQDVYLEYLRLFNEKVNSGTIMYDDYPLYEKINATTGESLEKTGVLANHIVTLRLVAEFCAENGLQFNKVFQANSYTDGTTTKRRAPTETDMYWQLNLGMAFGVSQYSYWSYYPLLNTSGEKYDSSSSFVDEFGKPNSLYYSMQKIHSEMQVMASALKHFTYKGAAMFKKGTVPGSTDYIDKVLLKENDTFTKLLSVTLSKSGAILVTESYDDNFEQYGYFVMNTVEPTEKANQSVTLNFSNANNVLIYKDGEIQKFALTDGKITIDLAVGHGAFVLPY